MSKLIYGVGYNSKAKYDTAENGRMTKAYNTWCGLLRRCYCPKAQLRNPNYTGCTVAEEWHDFQNFAEWFYGHEYSIQGYQLDKDLLFTGNKVYNPETCCFVPPQINSLLTNRKAARGKYPQGVTFHKDVSKYRVRLNVSGKQEYLGCFDSIEQAYLVYKEAKETYVKASASKYKGVIAPEVFNALMNWQL